MQSLERMDHVPRRNGTPSPIHTRSRMLDPMIPQIPNGTRTYSGKGRTRSVKCKVREARACTTNLN